MNLKDLVKADGLQGYGELTLLDERGRVKQVEKFENFVSIHTKEYLQELIASLIHYWNNNAPAGSHSQYGFASNNASTAAAGTNLTRVPTQNPFEMVYLSDSNLAESSATERLVPGNILGTGLKVARAAQGNVIGIVTASSSSTRLASTYRWEWASGQANGTIRSVGWCQTSYVDSVGVNQTTYRGLYAPLAWECYLPRNNRTLSAVTCFAIRHTDGRVYFSDGTTTLKHKDFIGTGAPPSRTNTVTDSVSPFTSPTSTGVIPASTTIGDLAWDPTNSRLWIANGTSPYNIISIDPGTPGTTVNNFTTSGSPSRACFIACDGTNIYYCNPVANLTASVTIYKVPIATGVSSTFATHTLNASPYTIVGPDSQFIQGMYWDFTNSKLVIVEMTGDHVAVSTSADYCRFWCTIYNGDGTFFGTTSLENGVSNTTQVPGNPHGDMTGTSYPHGFHTYNGYLYTNIWVPTSSPISIVMVHKLSNMASRSLLGSPVTKTSSNSLRLDYTVSVA